MMRFLEFAIAAFLSAQPQGESAVAPLPLIGYTQLQTSLEGGRHANVRTMRAAVVRIDGTGGRLLAAEIADDPDSWTQFAGWSPDGGTAIVGRGWQSLENAKWEEEHKSFRHVQGGWLLDSYLVNMETGKWTNVTAVGRVSFYNSINFWPGDTTKLGLTALVGGASKPFRMDLDGRNKQDLNKDSSGFVYGLNASRDGTRIAYHENYQVYLAEADGSRRIHVNTRNPFNFGPTWSPDGEWVLFVSGEHYNCHPHLVRADGTGLKKVADRGGYRGVTEFLDVPDFHGGSSDTPTWSVDGKSFFYTAKVGPNVELFQSTLDGRSNQLTTSPAGTTHYHPKPSPDGQFLLYGSRRDGVRQILIMNLANRRERQLTDLRKGHGAMWPHWQPLLAANNELGR